MSSAFSVQTMHTHASKCKKSLDDCILCQTNIAAFAEIPLPQLAIALEQVQRPPLRASMKDLLVASVFKGQTQFNNVFETFKKYGITVKG